MILRTNSGRALRDGAARTHPQPCSRTAFFPSPCRHQQRHLRWLCHSTDESKPPEQTEEGWLWSLGSSSSKQAIAELKREKVKAKKSLGQNFLTDDKILAEIVYSSGIRAGDLVLEVGPGTGNLTRHLVATGAQVTAVEKDDYLVTKLEAEFAKAKNFRLLHGDITKVDIGRLLEEMQQQERGSSTPRPSPSGRASTSSPSAPAPPAAARKLKVVANLPYNITKEFLTIMFPRCDAVAELSIMIQEEVARRLVNKKPGGKDWRAMSLTTHYYSRPKYRFRIPRAKYYPVPGVDGALVTFYLREPAQRPSVPDEAGFMTLVKKGFNQRRKMLRNSLQGLHSGGKVEAALGALGLNIEARAQDLTVERFAELAWQLETLSATWVDEDDGGGAGRDAEAGEQDEAGEDDEEEAADGGEVVQEREPKGAWRRSKQSRLLASST